VPSKVQFYGNKSKETADEIVIALQFYSTSMKYIYLGRFKLRRSKPFTFL